MRDLIHVGTFLLLMTWPGDDATVIGRNMKIQTCAGVAAVSRIADERWQYRCQLATTNAFKLFRRRT